MTRRECVVGVALCLAIGLTFAGLWLITAAYQ
jgi:hypothetical protein